MREKDNIVSSAGKVLGDDTSTKEERSIAGRVLSKSDDDGWNSLDKLPKKFGWYLATVWSEDFLKNETVPVWFNGSNFLQVIMKYGSSSVWAVKVVRWTEMPEPFEGE